MNNKWSFIISTSQILQGIYLPFKKYLLFIWNSNLTGILYFFLLNLVTLTSRLHPRPFSIYTQCLGEFIQPSPYPDNPQMFISSSHPALTFTPRHLAAYLIILLSSLKSSQTYTELLICNLYPPTQSSAPSSSPSRWISNTDINPIVRALS